MGEGGGGGGGGGERVGEGEGGNTNPLLGCTFNHPTPSACLGHCRRVRGGGGGGLQVT